MIKKIINIFILTFLCTNVQAISFNYNNWDFKIDASGMYGFIEPNYKDMLSVYDWDLKTQIIYNINTSKKFGIVYSIDEECLDSDEYIHDAFVLYENRKLGRIEIGLTNSVIKKMGLGLPDVSDLRINNKSILYKRIHIKQNIIADTTANTGHEALRLNIVTTNTSLGQYGVSFAGLTDEFDYTADIAMKIKKPHGKLKTAYSLALSFMNNLKDYEENLFTPHTTADWRTQAALGLNLQYNSFIVGLSSRFIYDKNPLGKPNDGFVVGTGASYDLLKTSISLNYLFSNTGIWHNKLPNDHVNTFLASLKYKYSANVSLWMSTGITAKTPFGAVGAKIEF